MVEKTLILHPKVFSSTKFYFLSIEKALIAAFPTINQTLENPPITPPSLSLLVLLILYYYSLLACPVYTFSTKNSCFSFSTTTPCSPVSSTRFLRLLCFFFSSLPRYRSASINTSLAVRRFGTCNHPFHFTVRSRRSSPALFVSSYTFGCLYRQYLPALPPSTQRTTSRPFHLQTLLQALHLQLIAVTVLRISFRAPLISPLDPELLFS